METLGEIIKQKRNEKGLPLRTVAAALDIDQAILSKLERGKRTPSRDLVVKMANYFEVNEDELLVAWLSDKLVYELADEELGLKALQIAETKVKYIAFAKIDRKEITRQLVNVIRNFEKVNKAWVFGSFSRGDDNPTSDIDIAITTDGDFSYFDLADVQFQMEEAIKRKVDVGFLDSFKPYILEHVKPDLKLIYER